MPLFCPGDKVAVLAVDRGHDPKASLGQQLGGDRQMRNHLPIAFLMRLAPTLGFSLGRNLSGVSRCPNSFPVYSYIGVLHLDGLFGNMK
jgi:hypothetical protein